MLGKVWKKILLIVLIIACLFNIVKKLVQRESLKAELESTLNYFSKQNETVQSQTDQAQPNQSQPNQSQINQAQPNQSQQNQSQINQAQPSQSQINQGQIS